MPEVQLILQLVALAKRLQQESAGFLENPGDTQSWYNRGYGAGIFSALRALGYDEALDAECVEDAPEALAPHRIMAWGQAYTHGHEKGAGDAREVLEERVPGIRGD